MSIDSDILRETLHYQWLCCLQNRERCLVFDFRLSETQFVLELQAHAWLLYW